jgi:hypothetical protein
MNKIVLAFTALAISTAPALAAGWVNETTSDNMTGTARHIAVILADEKPSDFINHAVNTIGIRCEAKKIVVIGLTNGYISNESAKLDYVINNDGKVKTIRTSVTTDGTGYFIDGKAAVNFAKTLAAAQSFKINAYDYNGTAKFSSFNNNLSKDAATSVLAKCGVKG